MIPRRRQPIAWAAGDYGPAAQSNKNTTPKKGGVMDEEEERISFTSEQVGQIFNTDLSHLATVLPDRRWIPHGKGETSWKELENDDDDAYMDLLCHFFDT
jgi:hypothetical protein